MKCMPFTYTHAEFNVGEQEVVERTHDIFCSSALVCIIRLTSITVLVNEYTVHDPFMRMDSSIMCSQFIKFVRYNL
jgi:hypothetical protein